MAKFITCEHCQRQATIESMLQERPIKGNLLEVGLLCECGIWTHSYFTTDEMKAKALRDMELLQAWQSNKEPAVWRRYETARDAYRNQFSAFNRRWRRKFGMLK